MKGDLDSLLVLIGCFYVDLNNIIEGLSRVSFFYEVTDNVIVLNFGI